MHKRVQRKEVDVVIAGKGSPQGKVILSSEYGSAKTTSAMSHLPNPDELAARYGVEAPSNARAFSPERSLQEEQDYQQSQQELIQAIAAMKSKLDEKNRKIDHLCVLLEALEPVPGVDSSRLQALATDKIQDDMVDLRDAKIVSLAKKSHNLQMVINKERAKNDRLQHDYDDLRKRQELLQQELELQKAANASNKSDKVYNRHALVAQSKKDEEDDLRISQQRSLRDALKSVDELKEKLKKANEDNGKMQKALIREVGEGVTLEQAVDGGWRGRAQQIVMLKAKVKQLEQNGNTGNNTRMQMMSKGNDVDSKAEEELHEMSKDRRQVVEALTEERIK